MQRSILTVFISAFIFLILIVPFEALSRNFSKKDAGGKKWVLGFCPTMEPYAIEIAQKIPDVEIKTFPSAFSVLSSLRSGGIDVGLIGRKARQAERLPEFKEKRIKDGWTLIAATPSFIDYKDLSKEAVHTYFKKDRVKAFLSPETKIIYYETKEAAFRGGFGGVILADWSDVPNDFALLIPVEDGKKVPRFRAPFLYSNNGEVLETITQNLLE